MLYSRKLNIADCEIIVRRRDTKDFAAYCPQLLYMIKGKSQIEVKTQMEQYIQNRASESYLPEEYIEKKYESEKLENEIFSNNENINKAMEELGMQETESYDFKDFSEDFVANLPKINGADEYQLNDSNFIDELLK